MLIRLGWLDCARLLFGRIGRRFRERSEAKALEGQQEAFYLWLKRAGYPTAGSTIMVYDVPEDRQRFLMAVAFALHKLLSKGTPPDG